MLIVLGAVLLLAIDVPERVSEYVDVLDLGLILIWTGLLQLGVLAWFARPPRWSGLPPRPGRPYDDGAYDEGAYDEGTHDTGDWRSSDVHRPGYAGETRRLPTIRQQ